MIPTLFHIGPFPVHSFGLMVLLAFVMGVGYAVSQVRKQAAGPATAGEARITPDHIFDLAVAELFVSIVGARTLYIFLNRHEFAGNPWDVVKIWTGGISIHGAIVAGSLYLWWYCRRHKLPFGKLADLAAPSFALGYSIGRIGCFLNGCCYGHACSLPWAVRFLKDGHEGVWTPPSHPTQLYATLMGLIIFGILHFWRKRPHRDGEIILGFFGLYCIYRFIDEEFRKGATADIFVAGMTHSQVFSLVVLPIVLFLLLRLRRGTGRTPAASAPDAADLQVRH
jgi:phosphatidylglycerol---prolipoprotein diacylglyceryl transferase